MKKFTVIIAGAALLLAGCGMSPEENEIADVFRSFVDNVENKNFNVAFDIFSSNTVLFMDDLASGMRNWGATSAGNGRELFIEMMEEMSGDELKGFSKQINSVVIDGNHAALTILTDDGDEISEFILEDGSWKIDWEVLLYESVNEGLSETGIDLADLLPAHLESGEGFAFLKIVHGIPGRTIWYIFIRTPGEHWSEDCLGSDLLYYGDDITVFTEPGIYDIRVLDENDNSYIFNGIETDENGFEWLVTPYDIESYSGEPGYPDQGSSLRTDTGEGSTSVTVINDLGSWTIWYVYIDPSIDTWGENRLGSRTLSPGDTVVVWVDPGEYDFMAKDEDDDTYSLNNIYVGTGGYNWNVTLTDLD